MRAFIHKVEGKSTIWLQARATGAGGTVGDMVREIHKGEEYAGYTYEELEELAVKKGRVTLPKKGWSPPAKKEN